MPAGKNLRGSNGAKPSPSGLEKLYNPKFFEKTGNTESSNSTQAPTPSFLTAAPTPFYEWTTPTIAPTQLQNKGGGAIHALWFVAAFVLGVAYVECTGHRRARRGY